MQVFMHNLLNDVFFNKILSNYEQNAVFTKMWLCYKIILAEYRNLTKIYFERKIAK